MARPIRVALVNDYTIVLEGLRALLKASEPEIHVVEIAVRKTPRQRIDVTLLDTYGELGTLANESALSAADPATSDSGVQFFGPTTGGAPRPARRRRGFISKSLPREQIIDGIKAAARGESVVLTQRSHHAVVDEALRWPGRDIGLTERESELLSLLSTGMTNRELGNHLYISENTVKTQLRHLYAKLNIRNRAQAVAIAGQGLLGDHRRQTKAVD